jgi:hypothetical protein
MMSYCLIASKSSGKMLEEPNPFKDPHPESARPQPGIERGQVFSVFPNVPPGLEDKPDHPFQIWIINRHCMSRKTSG